MSADYTMMNPAQYLSGTLLPLFDKNEVTVVANTFFNTVADGNQGGQNLNMETYTKKMTWRLR